MKVLLIADSPEFECDYIARYAGEFERIVVTDGAVHRLPNHISPDVVCGDFDSSDVGKARERYPNAEFVYLSDQNQNDLEKALVLMITRGASEIVMASALGGRPDVALANIATMVRLHTECMLSMVGRGTVTRVVSDRAASVSHIRFNAGYESVISCIAFERESVVSISNVRWPLSHAQLRVGSHGVSNRALGGEVEVRVHSGLVLLSHEV